jgi:hypothetical protein
MNCVEFANAWNALLDARDHVHPGLEESVRAHAASCPACGALAAGFVRLRSALAAGGVSPAVPAGFADRVLAGQNVVERDSDWWLLQIRRTAWVASAAALLVVGLVGLRNAAWQRSGLARPSDAERLDLSIGKAASATLALARTTSDSAARLSGEVADAASVPPLPLPDPVSPSADALQDLGETIAARVQPLSGSARHAFSFLLNPAFGTREKPDPARAAAPKPPA